jgi:dipeptidyl aminopeptidase/acylaminoacyl peptidase
MKFYLIVIFISLCSGLVHGQKKTINHEVYNDWKSLRSPIISAKGNFVSYQIKPHRGDGLLFFGEKDNPSSFYKRGRNPKFSKDESLFVFSIHPGFDTLRKLELDKVDKKEWVKDSLGILLTDRDSLIKFGNIKEYGLSKNNNWIVFLEHSNEEPKKEVKKKRWWNIFRKKKEEVEKPSSNGQKMTVFNPIENRTTSLYNVASYQISNNGEYVIFSTHFKGTDNDSIQIKILDTDDFSVVDFKGNFTDFSHPSFDEKSKQAVFLASKDTADQHKVYNLYLWDLSRDQPELVIDTNRNDLPKGLTVSAFRAPSFSQNGEKLFIGLKEIPKQEPEDTLTDSEKVKLDLWHWKDKRLQPQQLLERERDLKDTYLSVIHLKENKLVQLEDDTLSVRTMDKGNSNVAMGYSNNRHQHTYNWTYPWLRDYYLVDLESGKRTLLKKDISYGMLSPQGRSFIYYDLDENHYKSIVPGEDTSNCITCFMKDTTVVWTEDINGMPHQAGPIGVFGFTKNDHSAIIHSEHDIWEVELGSNNIWSISNRLGKRSNQELRLKTYEPDSTYIDYAQTYIHAVDLTTRDERILNLVSGHKNPTPENLMETPHKIVDIQKATHSNDVLYRKMNVKDYPDLYVTNTSFQKSEKISSTNPQQDEYRWPTVQKIEWTSPKGKKLEGLVYLPEDYDASKSYPMLVYFYELYAQRMHQHYIPKPTASIIYATEYTSAEYVVFIPDVRYDEGYPAQSAYDCIVSGTDTVLSMFPNIDSTRLGLQGQSWGGYQTAQLVTMTNKYKAAMAGAPVVNMFSAYGGIRWGSGLNRQFQYERTQSRIGKTIWEAPELYIENSPLFGVPKIETPLLIMHNDDDGAVPWYQGIEMFTAMKRLGKPVWMLNYNGDKHNLMQNANRMDLSIRMRQFFDHYLKGEPAPQWLIDGLPATVKGKELRLDLIEEEE